MPVNPCNCLPTTCTCITPTRHIQMCLWYNHTQYLSVGLWDVKLNLVELHNLITMIHVQEFKNQDETSTHGVDYI